MENNKTNKTPTDFNALIQAFNDSVKTKPSKAYEKALTDLATATAYSVMKKIIVSSNNPTMIKFRNELTQAKRDLASINYSAENATALKFKTDGTVDFITTDEDLATALNKLCEKTVGDGLDLVNDAVVSILEQTKAQAERDPDMPTDLLRPYTVRRLNRKVRIKLDDTVGGWETVETTPMREVYKAVRRAIENTRAVQTDPRNGYTYIDDLVTDPETGETDRLYYRMPKYADIGGQQTDRIDNATDYVDGQPTDAMPTALYTTDIETVKNTNRIISNLGLTVREMEILKLRQRGYGNKAIATYLGISENACKGALHRIRHKAEENGLSPKK